MSENASANSESVIEGWAILELMGHRRLGGYLSEVSVAAAAMVRIDVPHPQNLGGTPPSDRGGLGGEWAATQFYAGHAIYAITPTTEEIARAIARRAPEPVSRWELPALTGPGSTGGLEDVDEADFAGVMDEAPFD